MESIYIVMEAGAWDYYDEMDYEDAMIIIFKTLEEAKSFIISIMNSEPNEHGTWVRNLPDDDGNIFTHFMYIKEFKIGENLQMKV